MNCHTVTEFPRQTDNRIRHQQLVVRGPDNMGSAVMRCAACHQATNSSDGRIPGAPHWKVAPLSMGWEGLSDSQLCASLKDKSKNGGRDVAALVAHMTRDPLVLWAWEPGSRTKPPLDQASFQAALDRWASSGALCPG